MFLSPKKKKESNLDDAYMYSGQAGGSLPTEEIRKCRQSFKVFDSEGVDTLSMWEMRLALESLGLYPVEENISKFLSDVDRTSIRNDKIDFPGFLSVYQKQKEFEKASRDPSELLLAFKAMGGNADGTGKVSILTLQKILRDDYSLAPFKIDDLVEQLDTDEKDITFQQFCVLFG